MENKHHKDHKNMTHGEMNHDTTDHSKMDHGNMDHSKMDHSKMDHSKMDHSKMDHSQMDHSKMDHSKMDHSKMDHGSMDHGDMDHSMHGMGNLKQMFFISLIFAIPVLLISPMMGIRLPFQFTFPGAEWVVLILSTILFFYGGMPFIKGGKMEIQMKSPGMMTLIALGISVSYFYSVYAFIANNFLHLDYHVMDFFWELASLILIMLLGHWIEMNAVASAGNALEKMAALLPSQAIRILEDGTSETVDLHEINEGDLVQVMAGENMPVDGLIVKGSSTANEAMITGESLAVVKKVGDSVIGGSVNGMGSLVIEVKGTGESGYLAQVMELVSNAQKDKSKNELLSNIVAKWLFYIALIVGILAFVIWLLVTKDLNRALERLVTVLIIACPHALGLAIPLVVARSTSLAARNGLLIKNRQAFEQTKHIDTILLDKTGTLTEGDFKVTQVMSYSDQYSEDDILSLFSSLEITSSHPLALGILEETDARSIKYETASDVETIAGVGMQGKLGNQLLLIANDKYLKKNNYTYDSKESDLIASKGNSVSFLLVDDKVLGHIAQGDTIKKTAFAFIEDLKKRGIEPVMLTGDNRGFAKAVADQLGMSNFQAELMPEDKERIVRDLKAQGRKVMMVGDGINDAPSLVSADIGVAVGAGTDVAIDAADIVLVKSDPTDIIHLLNLGRNTSRKMIQNLWWGAGYNFLAIPLAAGVLAFAGILLSPAVGALLMSVSTVIVAINAIFLKMD